MSNIQLTWMADELRAAGLNVEEHDGWKTRTSGTANTFQPTGLLNHHTAGSSVLRNYPDEPYWTNSRLENSCNITIKPDGTVAVLNAGYAYDSGQGDPKVVDRIRAGEPVKGRTGIYPSDFTSSQRVNGNPYFIDIEVQHRGDGGPIVPVQREALIKTNAVILTHYGWDPNIHLLGHKEWSRRKIDPRWEWNNTTNPMSEIRADTATEMENLDMTPEQMTVWADEYFQARTKEAIDGNTYHVLDKIAYSVWASEVGRDDRREMMSHLVVEARNYSRDDYENGDGGVEVDPDQLAEALADAIMDAGPELANAVADELGERLTNG